MKGPSYHERTFGPIEKKTFAAALDRFLEEHVPQMSGRLCRQVIVDEIQKLVDAYYPPRARLRVGQVMWVAVDETEKAGYGKRMENTRIKPVFLDLVHPEDFQGYLKHENPSRIKQRVAVRLFQQTKKQGGVLALTDVAMLMHLSNSCISNYVRDWEKSRNELVPRRGTVHDLGPSITHKRTICHKVLIEGKSIEQTCRETQHSPQAVTRYVNDYKRIHTALRSGLSVEMAAFVTKHSEHLVNEYKQMGENINQLDTEQDPDILMEDNVPF